MQQVNIFMEPLLHIAALYTTALVISWDQFLYAFIHTGHWKALQSVLNIVFASVTLRTLGGQKLLQVQGWVISIGTKLGPHSGCAIISHLNCSSDAHVQAAVCRHALSSLF